MTLRSIVLYWKKNIDTSAFIDEDYYDDYYYIELHDKYIFILEWLKDNGIWYHSVQRDGKSIHFEVLYMDEEDAMAFKLRWI